MWNLLRKLKTYKKEHWDFYTITTSYRMKNYYIRQTAQQWMLQHFVFYVWKLTKQLIIWTITLWNKLLKCEKLKEEKYQLDLEILNYIQVTFGKKCLRIFGPNIWNNLPYHIKSSKNVESFKSFIKNLNGLNCKCVICKKF